MRAPNDVGAGGCRTISAANPLRPAGEHTAVLKAYQATQPWAWHVFVSVDARWVGRDITLGGNTFRDSHRVDKRNWVGDVGYGLVVLRGRWRVALVQHRRTREFERQEPAVFGSLSISRAF